MIPEKCACVMDKYILKDVTPQLYEKTYFHYWRIVQVTQLQQHWRYAQQCFVIGGNLARETYTCNATENNSQHTVLTLLGLHLLYLEMGLYEIAIYNLVYEGRNVYLATVAKHWSTTGMSHSTIFPKWLFSLSKGHTLISFQIMSWMKRADMHLYDSRFLSHHKMTNEF